MANIEALALIVEDDVNTARILKYRLEKMGFGARCAATAKEALAMLQENEFDIVLLDIGLPDQNGIEVLREIRKSSSLVQLIIVTGNTQINVATEALRLGAVDYLVKPIDFDQLGRALTVAMDRLHGIRQKLAIQRLVESRAVFPVIVAESPAMREVMNIVTKIAPASTPVLIQGETGTGKELIARTIHLKSPRSRESFLPVNCASIPASLLESELFGHEKGAFTGATELRRGLFEVANKGTLFMDEIGEMSPAMQSALLRVLETGEFRRVGGRTNLSTNVRIIAATNRDLHALAESGGFRQDLFYRLNTVTISLPPLRNRKEDIWPLAQHFLTVLCKETARDRIFSDSVREIFEAYSWPGNVRELRNVVERLILLSDRKIIELSDLPGELALLANSSRDKEDSLQLDYVLAETEKRHIIKVLRKVYGNRREAARLLGLSEPTLYRKLKEHNIVGDQAA